MIFCAIINSPINKNLTRKIMNKRVRQYVGLLSAIIAYYLIHEGAHLIYALFTGVFKQINFMGLGMQIDP